MSGVEARSSDSSRARKSRGRGRGLRTNTGCITCRKRHLKCDETKPICQQCTRNKKSCTYADAKKHSPENREVSVQQHGDPTSAPSHPSSGEAIPDVSGTPTVTQQQETLSPHHAHNNAGLHPTVHGNDSHNALPNFNYTSPVSVTSTSIDQPIGIATARWFGMLAGDAEIELDSTVGSGTTFQGPDTVTGTDYPYPNDPSFSQVVPESNNNAVSADLATFAAAAPGVQQIHLEEGYPWQTLTLLSLKEEELVMFHTFVTHISQWIDLFDPDRHFASLVPRLALHNVGLMNAILALSVRHKSLSRGGTNQPTYAREDALQYYHETLQYIRRAMQYETYHTSLELLATTLIVSTYEMLDGSSRDWERHLQGVFWIQRSQVIHGDSGGLRGAVWWAWICQDVWAAFRDKRKVFTFWKPEKTMADLNPVQLAARSVFMLGRVVNYCAQDESNDTPNDIVSRLRTADSLSAMLDDWASRLTQEFYPLPHSQSQTYSAFPSIWIHPPIFAVATQVYHATRILVLLHRPTLGGFKEALQRQNSLDRHVDVICGVALMLSSYASSTMSSQCLFIAGLCTHDRQRRKEILHLLDECHSRTGWPVVPLGQELKQCWQNSVNG